jgi:chitosanase
MITTLLSAGASASISVTKSAAIQMTDTLENSQTNQAWNYAKNINDGRGITFGCIGFCTGTYDGNILIKYYTTLNPNNPLAKYIPALDAIDAGSHNAAGGDGNPDTTGLSGFIQNVQSDNDPLFKQAQLYELDQMYWNPALSEFNAIGAKYPLTQALLYDATVREGADSMQSLVSQAGSTTDEATFDQNFIHVYTSALKKENLGDTDRMVGFQQVLDSGNVNLVTPYKFTAYGDSFTINEI